MNDMTLMNHWGKAVPLSQVGHVEIRPEEPILKRRDRVPTITVESDIDESLQPPQVSTEIEKAIQPIIAKLPEGFGYGNSGLIKLSFRIEKGSGLHLLESPLSEDQQVWEEKKHYRITATVVDSEMLDWWLRGFGRAVSRISKTRLVCR